MDDLPCRMCDQTELGQSPAHSKDWWRACGPICRCRQQFMADASHAIRTPVSVMRAADEVISAPPGAEESD